MKNFFGLANSGKILLWEIEWKKFFIQKVHSKKIFIQKSIVNFFSLGEKFFSEEKFFHYGSLNGKKFFPRPKIFLGGKKN